MKKWIVPLLFIFSATPVFCASVFALGAAPDKLRNLEQPSLSSQQKTEAATGYMITMLDMLVQKNIITAARLQYLQESPELINPMTAEDRAASSTNLVYAKGLDSFIAQGKQFIDVIKVKAWSAVKIAELEKAEDTRKQVHEDTREIYRSMKFVEIPAGKYIDQITGEECEILPGIEMQDTPVTQWQWFTEMGENPAHFIDGPDAEEVIINGKKIKIRADAPVENVCWNDVHEFIQKLNTKNDGYVYALPSVGEYQVMIQSFKQNGSFAEYQGKRVWDITGKIWQCTRDSVEMKDKQAHLVFGGKRQIQKAKDMVRPVAYGVSKNQRVGLRLVRYKKSAVCEQKASWYSSNQLAWNVSDCSVDSVWDKQTNVLLLRGGDGLRWMIDHKADYSAETQHTLDALIIRVGEHIDNLLDTTTLWFDYNQIQDLSPFAHLINLIWLSLSYLSVRDISPLAHLISLTQLFLNDNQIQDISPLAHLPNLTKLFIHNNQIQDLRPLAHLTDLKFLLLYNNPVKIFSNSSNPVIQAAEAQYKK